MSHPPRRMMARVILLCVLFCSLALTGQFNVLAAPPRAKVDPSKVDAMITSLMEMYTIPGVGLALIEDGQVAYLKGYGYGDVAAKKPATEDTIFGIGSVSKSFTALAVMQLVEQGKIDLEAPVTKYVPDFKLKNPDYTPLLKVRHLLEHTSGLPRADELWASSVPASREQAVKDMEKITPTAKPGELWQYCNQNFTLAGYIVEKVTGQSWEEYTRQNIFGPLGMTSANFAIEDLVKAPDHALPYNLDVIKDFGPEALTSDSYQAVKPLGPAGSINANAKQMSSYALMQLGKGPKLVSDAALTKMHTEQIKTAGSPEGDSLATVLLTTGHGYGFGWITESYRDKAIVQHGGKINGYTSSVTLIPAEGVAVVLLVNVTHGDIFIEAARLQLLEMLLGLSPTADLVAQVNKRSGIDIEAHKRNVAAARSYKADPKTLEAYVGPYTSQGGDFKLILKEGVLHFSADGVELALHPISATEFLLNGVFNMVVRFQTEANGVITILQGNTTIGQRSDGTLKPTAYEDPKGSFSLTLPAGLNAEQKEDYAQITVKESGVTFYFGAVSAGSDTLDMVVASLVKRFAPKISGAALNKRPVPAGALTWTQYIYQDADKRLFVVEAVQQGETVYYILIDGDQAGITKVTPALNTMLLSLKVKG